jgi:flagellin
MRKTSNLMSKAMERISSGLKINSAVDDAGGLAMGMKLSLETKIAENVQNSVDSVKSLVSAQSTALMSAEDIIAEMQTVKSEYDAAVDGSSEQGALQEEFNSLRGQLTTISQEKFNNNSLFGSTDGDTSYNVSTTSDGTGVIEVGKLNLNSGDFEDLKTADISTLDSGEMDTLLEGAYNQVTSELSRAAGKESSLGFASSYLESKAVNLEAARSRVMDADLVEESTNLSKYTMQYEASAAAIAQANATQQTVMELLLFPTQKKY